MTLVISVIVVIVVIAVIRANYLHKHVKQPEVPRGVQGKCDKRAKTRRKRHE